MWIQNAHRNHSALLYWGQNPYRFCYSWNYFRSAFFVVGPEASHLPNINNTLIPCTIMSLGSRLLLITVTLSLRDEENIQLLWVRRIQVILLRKIVFLLQSNGIAVVGSNNMASHSWCKCVDFKGNICFHTRQSGQVTLHLSNYSLFSLTYTCFKVSLIK
jgi:hypothetical protein